MDSLEAVLIFGYAGPGFLGLLRRFSGEGLEAVRIAQSVEPEGIVMDVIMPHKDGVEVCRDILALLPDTRAQMLTASTQEDVVYRGGRRWRYRLPPDVFGGRASAGGRSGRRRGQVAGDRNGGCTGFPGSPQWQAPRRFTPGDSTTPWLNSQPRVLALRVTESHCSGPG